MPWTSRLNFIVSCTNSLLISYIIFIDPPSTPKISIDDINRVGTVKVINDTVVPVTCSSSSKPSPTYTWWYKNTETSGNNINLKVVGNSTLRCTATNTMMTTSTDVTRNSSADISFHVLCKRSLSACLSVCLSLSLFLH